MNKKGKDYLQKFDRVGKFTWMNIKFEPESILQFCWTTKYAGELLLDIWNSDALANPILAYTQIIWFRRVQQPWDDKFSILGWDPQLRYKEMRQIPG